MKHNKPHYYLNPLSSKVISSSGRIYKTLKKRGFKLQPDKCLYNISSAKKCLNSILNKYNGLVHPSSNFIDIPSTYPSPINNSIAFIKNKSGSHIKGALDKTGQLYKIYPEIQSPNKIPEIHTLKEHSLILHNKFVVYT